MSQSSHRIEKDVQPVEFLSYTPAKVEGEKGVAMEVRIDPMNSYETTTIFVPLSQAERMVQDLGSLLKQDVSIWK